MFCSETINFQIIPNKVLRIKTVQSPCLILKYVSLLSHWFGLKYNSIKFARLDPDLITSKEEKEWSKRASKCNFDSLYQKLTSFKIRQMYILVKENLT